MEQETIDVVRLVYSPKELRAALGVSAGTMDRYLKLGLIPSIRLGRRRFIPRAAVRAMFANCSVHSVEASER